MTPSTSPYLHTAPPLRRVMLQVAAATLPGVLVLLYWQGRVAAATCSMTRRKGGAVCR